MPYYKRDPKRDHNFDNHPYIVSKVSNILLGNWSPRDCLACWISRVQVSGFRDVGFEVWMARVRKITSPMLKACPQRQLLKYNPTPKVRN